MKHSFLFLSVFLLFGIRAACGQDHSAEHMQGHDALHDFYRQLTQPDGRTSCCSDRDCAPAEWRYTPTGIEAYDTTGNRWVAVPEERMLKIPTPDGRAHLCVSPTGVVYCFIKGLEA